MIFQEDFNLKSYNTFGISATCHFFADVTSAIDLQILLKSGMLQHFPYFILGGGSNVVFYPHFSGIVVHMATKGVSVVEDTGDAVLVKVAAGEVWSDFVDYCIANEWYGVENLTAIPGTVGASPIQNVGAYGVEAGDVIESVEAYEVLTGEKRIFSHGDCRFGYRNSIFKEELKGQYIVSAVTYRLTKQPAYQLGYGAISAELEKDGIALPTLVDISRVVARIRAQKLPDPKEVGSAGSFFKNPVIQAALYDKLKAEHPAMVGYVQGDEYKIAAGWLIEQCGWKGTSQGNVGVYEKQALVLYNAGGCNGEQVQALSDAIRQSVFVKFGIELEPEAIFV